MKQINSNRFSINFFDNLLYENETKEQTSESIIDEAARYLFDEGDKDYLPDYEEFNDYTMSIRKDLFEKAKERALNALEIKVAHEYEDYDSGNGFLLELNDNHTMWELKDNGKDDEEWYSIVNSKKAAFEAETGVELYIVGRSGRHVCVKPTYDNCLNFEYLQEVQERLEEEAIKEFNNINESGLKEYDAAKTEDAVIDDDPDLNKDQVQSDVDYWTDIDEANTEDVSNMEPTGVFTISNNMAICVYEIKYDINDSVLAGDSSDTTKAKWRDIIYDDGEPYFWYGDIKVPFNEIMRESAIIKPYKESDAILEAQHKTQKAEYTLIPANEPKIKELENGSAFTWEGLDTSPKSLNSVVDFFKENTPNIKLPVEFFTWKGSEMNRIYGLTGDNAYPDDLNFVSIALDNWDGMGALPMIKFQVGARWLDDIVDNNARRQGNLDESADASSLAKFIKSSVDKLLNTDYTNCKFDLDDMLSVYVGWSDGYDEAETDEYEIHNPKHPSSCINAIIGTRNDADFSDLDYINRPYYENGEIFEAEWTVSPSEDYNYLANSIIKMYDYMLELLSTGELLTESVKGNLKESAKSTSSNGMSKEQYREKVLKTINKIVEISELYEKLNMIENSVKSKKHEKYVKKPLRKGMNGHYQYWVSDELTREESKYFEKKKYNDTLNQGESYVGNDYFDDCEIKCENAFDKFGKNIDKFLENILKAEIDEKAYKSIRRIIKNAHVDWSELVYAPQMPEAINCIYKIDEILKNSL